MCLKSLDDDSSNFKNLKELGCASKFVFLQKKKGHDNQPKNGGFLATPQEIEIIPSMMLKSNRYEDLSLDLRKERRIKEIHFQIARDEILSFLKCSKAFKT